MNTTTIVTGLKRIGLEKKREEAGSRLCLSNLIKTNRRLSKTNDLKNLNLIS